LGLHLRVFVEHWGRAAWFERGARAFR
jgi:hypothetical protein